jgi:hypothetical protein
MGAGVLRAEGKDRGYAALIGVAEIYVVPVGLAAALFLRFSRRKRVLAVGVAIGTLAGAAVVLVATFVVGAGATWS